MTRNGFKILDSDMHVFEPHDLYLKYMDPKWGARIPRGEARKKHGQIKFMFGDGSPIRPSGVQVLAATTRTPIVGESSPGEAAVAHRYKKPLKRGYDAVSQLEAMDEEGLDLAVLFRTFPLHCDDSLDAEYANDRPPDDATFVKRLRDAGAIILAKANLAEYAVDGSRSSFGGTFCNPYDTEREPGMSSAGSGSAVADSSAGKATAS